MTKESSQQIVTKIFFR